jgi:hypothetical protein
LALCQRYFESSFDEGVAVGASSSNGLLLATCCGNLNRAYGHVQFKVPKRGATTVTFYSSSGASGNFRNAAQGTDVAVAAASNVGHNGVPFVISSGIVSVTDQLQGHYSASAEL